MKIQFGMKLAMDDPDVFKSYFLSWGHPAGFLFSGKYAFLDFWYGIGTELVRNWYGIGTKGDKKCTKS